MVRSTSKYLSSPLRSKFSTSTANIKGPLPVVFNVKGGGSLALEVDREDVMITLLKVSMILLEKAVMSSTMIARENIPPSIVLCYGSPFMRNKDGELKKSN